MKRTFLLLLAAFAYSGFAHAAGINLVTNGSFEQGTGGIGSFTGWQTTLGDVSTFVDSSGQTGTHAGQASEGLWSAYFGSTVSSGGSSIAQTLETTIGQTYLLTFDLANNNGGVTGRSAFLASVAGTALLSGSNLPAQDYVHEQFLFVASGIGTVLRFSGSNDAAYVQLDNVSVLAVPEPESIALMIFGSVMVGLTTRRKKSQAFDHNK